MKDMFQQLSALAPRDDKFDAKDPSTVSHSPSYTTETNSLQGRIHNPHVS